jgi:hypothetical protein
LEDTLFGRGGAKGARPYKRDSQNMKSEKMSDGTQTS